MIVAGLIIIAVSVTVACLNMLFLVFSDSLAEGVSIVVHVLCAIGSFLGGLLFVVGLLQHFEVI